MPYFKDTARRISKQNECQPHEIKTELYKMQKPCATSTTTGMEMRLKQKVSARPGASELPDLAPYRRGPPPAPALVRSQR